MATQQSLDFERIKQYPGLQQVERAVKVKVPGKHFPALNPAEKKENYEGTAMEYTERHKFLQHVTGWGNAHTGPGIRFVCVSDALDDPDHKGFWTTLGLWNRWRHETYKDNREAEMQFLDVLPSGAPAREQTGDAAKSEKQPPEIKQHFMIVTTGVHTFGGNGKMAGMSSVCTYYACKFPGCKRGPAQPIKQVGSATGQLFTHLEVCQPVLCQRLRADSRYSPVHIDDDGTEYEFCTPSLSCYHITSASCKSASGASITSMKRERTTAFSSTSVAQNLTAKGKNLASRNNPRYPTCHCTCEQLGRAHAVASRLSLSPLRQSSCRAMLSLQCCSPQQPH